MKVTVRDATASEKRVTVSGSGAMKCWKLAFGKTGRSALVWWDDVGHTVDLLIDASVSLGENIKVDASYTVPAE